jgi:hypothetical protein
LPCHASTPLSMTPRGTSKLVCFRMLRLRSS